MLSIFLLIMFAITLLLTIVEAWEERDIPMDSGRYLVAVVAIMALWFLR